MHAPDTFVIFGISISKRRLVVAGLLVWIVYSAVDINPPIKKNGYCLFAMKTELNFFSMPNRHVR